MCGEGRGRAGALSACLALAAGCDALLYPKDPRAVAATVAAWAKARPAHEALLRAAAHRVLATKGRLSPSLKRGEATVERIGAWMSGLWDAPAEVAAREAADA